MRRSRPGKFAEHDERLLCAQYSVRADEHALIHQSKAARRELEELFAADQGQGVLGPMTGKSED